MTLVGWALLISVILGVAVYLFCQAFAKPFANAGGFFVFVIVFFVLLIVGRGN